MVDGWSTSFHVGPILGRPRDRLARLRPVRSFLLPTKSTTPTTCPSSRRELTGIGPGVEFTRRQKAPTDRDWSIVRPIARKIDQWVNSVARLLQHSGRRRLPWNPSLPLVVDRQRHVDAADHAVWFVGRWPTSARWREPRMRAASAVRSWALASGEKAGPMTQGPASASTPPRRGQADARVLRSMPLRADGRGWASMLFGLCAR
jgi:hypothetical protein